MKTYFILKKVVKEAINIKAFPSGYDKLYNRIKYRLAYIYRNIKYEKYQEKIKKERIFVLKHIDKYALWVKGREDLEKEFNRNWLK